MTRFVLRAGVREPPNVRTVGDAEQHLDLVRVKAATTLLHASSGRTAA